MSLIMALILIASAVMSVSCGEKTGGNVTEAPATEAPAVQTDEKTEPQATDPVFSSRKYDGQTFTSYIRNTDASNYASLYIVPSDDDGDIVNSQSDIRNMRVEEKFNIKLEFIQASNPTSTLAKDTNDGKATYNLILDQRYKEGPVAQKGLLADFNKIGVDLTTSWWDKNAAEAYSAYNCLYVMPCDISVSNLGGVRFYCFNKAVLENFHLTSPYELAAKNEWTLENFYKLVKSVSSPATEGIGVYGLVNETSSVRNAMLKGIGIPWIEKIDEEHFEVTIGTTYKEKTQNYLDGLKEIFNDTTCVMDFDTAHGIDVENQSSYKDKYAHCRGLFATDHFLFVHTNMSCVKSQFGDMSKGFGVIMNPKWSPDQDRYYHGQDSNSICFCIPSFSDNDLQMVGDILDYWAWESSRTTMEAFYEITLKAKRADDPITAQMLDVVKGSIGYYISELVSIDVSAFVTQAYNSNVSSAWDTFKKSLPKSIDAQIKQFKAK